MIEIHEENAIKTYYTKLRATKKNNNIQFLEKGLEKKNCCLILSLGQTVVPPADFNKYFSNDARF